MKSFVRLIFQYLSNKKIKCSVSPECLTYDGINKLANGTEELFLLSKYYAKEINEVHIKYFSKEADNYYIERLFEKSIEEILEEEAGK